MARYIDMTTDVADMDYNDVLHPSEIGMQLHPLDVGFDLREHREIRIVAPRGRNLCVSYQAADGSRRVMMGPREAVLRRLRARGFRFATGR